jgi:F-type H+-transporting ATPase subunit gamma
MATLRQIQRRIKSVQSTAKTTRALSLVAGSKMRRAQQMALAHRPYAGALYDMLVNVLDDIENRSTGSEEGALHPLLARREVKTAGLILITSDRGLCGGLNTNLFRAGAAFLTANPDSKLITVGRKGSDFFRRTRTDIIATFMNLGDYPSYDDVRPISHLVAEAYMKGEVDSVSIVYPRFVNTVVQRPDVLRLLPAEPPVDREAEPNVEYIYEPDPTTVLADLLPRYVEIQVYRAVLEMAASYQSAQMVAMRNATDAAEDLVQTLTLLRNKVRQEQITKELLDITGGVEALSN